MYLLWDQEPYDYLSDAIEGVKNQTYDKDSTEFLLVYNSHKPENKSACPYIREEVEKHKSELSHVTILEQTENLGFSGGNNCGMQWALDNGFDYVFLHNGDGYMGADCLVKTVEALDKDKTIGAVQSLVMLHPETNLINSSGNAYQFLGFGYSNDYRKDINNLNLPEIKEIAYASGAAITMRTSLLKEFGLWDHDFFMYHEDTEYSFRLRMAGYKIVAVKDSVFYHKYQFSKSISKFFWMERNRYAVMLMFMRLPTLLLLMPMEIILEFGLWIFAFKGGWAGERWKVYKYWLKTENWKLWWGKRKKIQKMRKITDRKMLKSFAAGIYFQEKTMQNPILKYIGNPILTLYYWVVVRLLIWW